MQTFANWEDVPLFDQEDAEATFWAENRPALRLMESAWSCVSRPVATPTAVVIFVTVVQPAIRIPTNSKPAPNLKPETGNFTWHLPSPA